MSNIISWNPRLRNMNKNTGKKLSLDQLIVQYEPVAVCLQDCGATNFTLPGYQKCHFLEIEGRSTRILTAFCEGTKYHQIEEESTTQAVWQVYKVQEITSIGHFILINIYIPGPLNVEQWKAIDTLLGKYEDESVIITGDMNAEHQRWSTNNPDNQGQENANGRHLETSIDSHGFNIINSGTHTRIPGNTEERHTAIDITLTSGKFGIEDIEWETHDDACGSDHLPQIISIRKEVASPTEHTVRRKFRTEEAIPDVFRAAFDETKKDTLEYGNVAGEDSIDAVTKRITAHILEAAIKGIPNNNKSAGRKFKQTPPILKRTSWFNEECKKAKKERKKRQNEFQKYKTVESQIKYNKAKALFQKVIKEAKKRANQQLVDDINFKANPKEAWKKTNELVYPSKKTKTKIAPLRVDSNNPQCVTTDANEQAELLAARYHHVSDDKNLNQDFLDKRNKFKETPEGRKLLEEQPIGNEPTSIMEKPFSMEELQNQLNKRKKKSAAGPDELTYWMFRESPEYVKQAILGLVNKIWETGQIPEDFKTAQVIPFPKQDKDPSLPASYRPIALTSHLGKLMEAMVNDRLTSHLEEHGHLTNTQTGFRNKRETLEQLVRLEADIRKAWERNRVVCAVFLDLSAAFDTAQHIYILKNLAKYGVKGKMYNYCQNFMNNRQFAVRVGDQLSTLKKQNNGVPQGAVLSPTLFIVSVNELNKLVSKDTATAQYADDSALWKSYPKEQSRHPYQETEANISKETNKMIKGLTDLGYKVNSDKTQAVLFTEGRDEPYNLNIGGSRIKTTKTAKYLGVTLDSKLTYKAHLDNRRKSGTSVINLLYKLKKGKHFKKNPHLLRNVSKALLNSTVLYGLELLGKNQYLDQVALNKTKSVLRRARRIYTNTICTTSGDCVDALSGELPLGSLCQTATMSLWARKAGQQESPLAPLFTTKPKAVGEKYKDKGTIRTMHQTLQYFNIDKDQVAAIPKTNHANQISPDIDMSLKDQIKKKENSNMYMKKVTEEHMSKSYSDRNLIIYTDASKEANTGPNEKVGIGIYTVGKGGNSHFQEEVRCQFRLNDDIAIATAELKALHKSLDQLREGALTGRNEGERPLICTDSLSALQEIQARSPSREDIVQEIFSTLVQLESFGIIPTFLWIPSHCGIQGNEEADELAKLAVEKDTVDLNIKLGPNELKSKIKKEIVKAADDEWKGRLSESTHFMREMTPNPFSTRIPISEKYILRNRLLVNRPIFFARQQEICEACDVPKTPEHMLMECPRMNIQRTALISKFRKEAVDFNLANVLNPNPPRDLLRPILQYIAELNALEKI